MAAPGEVSNCQKSATLVTKEHPESVNAERREQDEQPTAPDKIAFCEWPKCQNPSEHTTEAHRQLIIAANKQQQEQQARRHLASEHSLNVPVCKSHLSVGLPEMFMRETALLPICNACLIKEGVAVQIPRSDEAEVMSVVCKPTDTCTCASQVVRNKCYSCVATAIQSLKTQAVEDQALMRDISGLLKCACGSPDGISHHARKCAGCSGIKTAPFINLKNQEVEFAHRTVAITRIGGVSTMPARRQTDASTSQSHDPRNITTLADEPTTFPQVLAQDRGTDPCIPAAQTSTYRGATNHPSSAREARCSDEKHSSVRASNFSARFEGDAGLAAHSAHVLGYLASDQRASNEVTVLQTQTVPLPDYDFFRAYDLDVFVPQEEAGPGSARTSFKCTSMLPAAQSFSPIGLAPIAHQHGGALPTFNFNNQAAVDYSLQRPSESRRKPQGRIVQPPPGHTVLFSPDEATALGRLRLQVHYNFRPRDVSSTPHARAEALFRDNEFADHELDNVAEALRICGFGEADCDEILEEVKTQGKAQATGLDVLQGLERLKSVDAEG